MITTMEYDVINYLFKDNAGYSNLSRAVDNNFQKTEIHYEEIFNSHAHIFY